MKEKDFYVGATRILKRFSKANRLTRQRALRKYADSLRETEQIDDYLMTLGERQDKVTLKVTDIYHTFSVTLKI